MPAPALTALRHAREQHAAVWSWLRLAGPLILSAQLAGLMLTEPRPGLHGEHLVLSAAIAAFAVGAFGTLLTRRAPFVLLLFASSIALALLQPAGPGVLGVFVAVLLVARRLPVRAGAALVGAGIVLLTIVVDPRRTASPLSAVVTGIALASFYAVTRLALRLSEINEQAERLLSELARTREVQDRAVALAERQRMAREMHDVLAHSLSGLMLQLEGARMVAEQDGADARLPVLIDRARGLARSGLAEARQAIGMLREEALPGPDELCGLATEFAEDTGVPCEVYVTGDPRPLGVDARLTVYRVAQESLTNVRKHARAERVDVSLEYLPNSVVLVVEDRGTLAAEASAGYGMAGMRERAELAGGRFHAGPTPTGFRVELDLPA
jgi:signal transduction histidine kinase